MTLSFALPYCALLATLLVAQTPTTQPPSKASENCTVQGQVVLQAGGQPLRKVSVQIVDDNKEENSYSALTDAEGHFKVEDVTPGHYNVRIERTGFLEVRKSRTRYYTGTLMLKRGQELKDLVFRMQPASCDRRQDCGH